ncbi:MAG: hypothetical protein ACR2G9_07735 [Gaiellaceae bacterium]
MTVVLLFVVPLLAVVTVAGFVLRSDDQPGVALAQGASGGAFHPVAGNFQPDDTELATCEADYPCLQQAFGNIAYRQGAKPALELFDTQIEANHHVKRDCHRIAHMIGSAAFARYDGNVARTFALGSATCASGYYHGILERAFVGVNTKTKLVDVARELCSGSGIRRRGFLDYQCQHGLGHGLMIQTGYDLPLALSTCSRLATGWDDVVCTGGVFMENVTTRFGFRSQWLEDDDPLYPCGRIALRNRRSCYLRAAVRVIAFHENDFEKAAATCGALARQWARACFRGYGRDAVNEARYSPVKIVSLCGLADDNRDDCLYGAARTVGDGEGFDGVRRAAKLCRLAPESDRDACFAGAGIIVGLLYPTDATRRRACERVATRYASARTEAAIAEVAPNGTGAWG